MDLLQKILKEVILKHTGIKQEQYLVPVQDTHVKQLHQDMSQLQTEFQILHESMATLKH